MPIGWVVKDPPVGGTLAAAIKKRTASMQGQQPTMGPLYSQLKKRTATMSGRVDPAGGIASSTKKLGMSANGTQTQMGSMAMSVKKPSFYGSIALQGSMSVGVKKTVATMVGNQPFTGALGASLKKAIAHLQGVHTQAGTMAASTKKRVATMVGKSSQISYVAPFGAVPSGLFNIKSPSGSGSTALNGTTLREAGSTASNGTYYTVGVLPDKFEGAFFSVEVSAAANASTDRGIGGGCSNDDGTAIVFFTICGQGGVTANIQTIIGTTRTSRATFNIQSTLATDLLKLVPTIDGSGVVTWTMHKNGTATGLTWTDTGHAIDLPGKHPAIAFRHVYNGGQFYSPGIDSMVAVDLS